MPPPGPATTSATPTQLGRYELLCPIGVGGMARVFLGRASGARGFERDVAIKVTHPHLLTHDHSASLIEEAKLASRIRHPNVVSVLDVGETDGGVYMVMDYVEGDVLSAILKALAAKKQVVPLRIALRILSDALAGLHAAHELKDDRGELLHVVHRDFSPQNILVGCDGTTRLTDFGIAKVANSDQRTATGLIKGKVRYMSPEQAHAEELDRRADVWSAAVVAWEVLAGQRMHPIADETAVLLRIVSEDAPSIRTVRPELPDALDAALARALHRSRAKRTESAAQLRSELIAAFDGNVADVAEVAEFVSDLVEPMLRERRERAISATRHGVVALKNGATAAQFEDTTDNTRRQLATTSSTREAPRRRWSRWVAISVAVVIGAALATVGQRVVTPVKVPASSDPLPIESPVATAVPATAEPPEEKRSEAIANPTPPPTSPAGVTKKDRPRVVRARPAPKPKAAPAQAPASATATATSSGPARVLLPDTLQ